MFDDLVVAASGACGAGAVGAWARVENAACARRLCAIADVLDARMAADDAAEREQWCLDNWDAVAAEVAAAHNVSLGVASHQLVIASALRERLPRVAEVFAAGAISYRLVAEIVSRTRMVTDSEAMAKVDTEVAAQVVGWGALSVAKTEAAIDYWVDLYDPRAVVRTELNARGRHVDVIPRQDGTGLACVEAMLFGHDADALDNRLDAMARGVCEKDPRTLAQRRSDALGTLGHGGDRLACGCGIDGCPLADNRELSSTVVHVIAEERSLADDTATELDGAEPPAPTTPQLRQMTIAEALAPPPATGPATTKPGLVIGGGLLPAPLLATKVAANATIRAVIHPGDAAPEQRYVPSRALADFVRCRDVTCRAPGCDKPATDCDLDHTIPYPVGPTCASNLKCLCRKHHLLKTFWGWLGLQFPDGTVVWTSPGGQTHTTHPGSRVLFPSLCRPTAPIVVPEGVTMTPNRGLMMPRRKATRAQDRAKLIEAERRLNAQVRDNDDAYFPSRPPPPGPADPPPF